MKNISLIIFSGLILVIGLFYLAMTPGKEPTLEDISWLDNNYEYILSSKIENSFVAASWDMERDYYRITDKCLAGIKKNIKNVDLVSVGRDKQGNSAVMVIYNTTYLIYGKSVDVKNVQHVKHIKSRLGWDVWLRIRE